jgi:hypothetical protein
MNLIKENILSLMANPSKIQLEAKEHKTCSDNAPQPTDERSGNGIVDNQPPTDDGSDKTK